MTTAYLILLAAGGASAYGLWQLFRYWPRGYR